MSSTSHAGRRPLVVANWKMNKTVAQTESFIQELLPLIPKQPAAEVVICPPFTALASAQKLLQNSSVLLGAQNLSENKPGAFTGEIAGEMLQELKCHYVVIGHSERRQYYGETDALVNKKIVTAFQNSLIPIVCVGETLEQREANKTTSVIAMQMQGAFQHIPSQQMQTLVIAYEPVWAIGTGKTATPEQAQEVHLFIRDRLKDQYGSLTSLAARILYGGSVKPDNMAKLMACEDIDGGLVGGASLEAKSFAALVNYK